MFGYVTIYHKGLSPAARDCYQAYYCGLCRELRRRYGACGQLALSYDMTFVAVLLTALYDVPTVNTRGRCALHAVRSRPRAANEFVAYAADMTVALAYYNFLDNWQDERSHASHFMAQQLAPHLDGIRARWPAQCAALARELAALGALEAARSTDMDALCNSFGRLLGAVMQPRADVWAPVLGRLGQGLGGFIYLMDAYDDLDRDARHGSFNALGALSAALPAPAFEQRCHELLTQQMALCAENFELLPILKQTPEGELLYNTLYSGVWSRYTLRHAMREKRHAKAGKEGAIPHDDGSV